jgi:cytochrome c-type biogenesis protein CcmH/NrfG
MLLVARPLVLGEDPGLLVDGLSDPSGLLLTLLWLILGTIWAVRQWASNGASIALDRLDAAMLALVAVIALGAGRAPYLHPARLIAWEWLVFWIVLVVIRRLARDELNRRCLLAAMLATGASISAYACYQSVFELPALRRQVQERSQTVMEELGREGIALDSDDPMLEAWRQRIMAGHAFGTFAHPNTFAGYLALLIPPACACAVFGLRERWRKRWTMAIMSLLLATALVLTHSRGAILGVALVGLLVAWIGGSKVWARRGFAWAIPAAIAAALIVGWTMAPSRGVELARKSLGLRLDYWTATVRMMTDPKHTDRLLFGVGPGMFGRYYPRYMSWTATEKISDPHNFLLELWTSAGTAAPLLIMSVLGISLAWCLPAAAAIQQVPRLAQTSGRDSAMSRLYMFAGVAGFVLAFALSAMQQEPDAVLGSAWMALARMLVWVIGYLAFASEIYPGLLLSIGLGAGVSACLINCLVSGGISFPALAQCLWAATALACPAAVASKRNRQGAYLWLLPATMGSVLVIYYVASIYAPVTQAWRYSNQARTEMASLSGGKSNARSAGALSARVILPLEQAVNSDPEDASLWVSLADGYGMLWRLDHTPEALGKALQSARNATRIDPEGKEGYLAEYRISESAAAGNQGDMLQLSVNAVRRIIDRDPSEAKWHYFLAEALQKSGQKFAAREAAEKAHELDQLAGSGPRRLNKRQREQLERWLRESR